MAARFSYLLVVPVGDGVDDGDSAADVVVFEVDRGELVEDLDLASGEPGRAARARASLEETLRGLTPWTMPRVSPSGFP
jgi:hypothetical protein